MPSLFRAHVAVPPPPRGFCMPRAAARAMALLTTLPATLSNTFVPADQQSRLGEHVAHGGDANRVACPPVGCAAAKYCFEGIEQ